jgi:hypothetical protein
MTTSNKKPATKTNPVNPINEAVQKHLVGKLSLNETAAILYNNKIDFSDIKSTIEKVGKANNWIFSPEKIETVTKDFLKDKKITHFLDVIQFAKDLKIPLKTEKEIQNYIIEFSGIEKSAVKIPAKFSQFYKNGYHGVIAKWITEHPEFTAGELLDTNLVIANNAADYYNEFSAYREFYRDYFVKNGLEAGLKK